MTDKRVVLVAAVADNGVIGLDGQIPWHLPGELKHFRRVTTGNVVVMGRKTFESIGHPLRDRTNIVVTSQRAWTAEGVITASSLEDALTKAEAFDGDVMVIGGGEIYAQAMPIADAQILTKVHASPDGDTYYPLVDENQWAESNRDRGPEYDIVWLERIFLG